MYGITSGGLQPYRKTNGTATVNFGSAMNTYFSANPSAARSVLFYELTRGGTISTWTFQAAGQTSFVAASGTPDVTATQFMEAMEIGDLTSANTYLATATGQSVFGLLGSPNNLTSVDEGTYGTLNAVGIYWYRNLWPIEISDVAIMKLA